MRKSWLIGLFNDQDRVKMTDNYSASYDRQLSGANDDVEDMLPHREMGQLSFEEKKFLLAVERGDVATVRRWTLTRRYYRITALG